MTAGAGREPAADGGATRWRVSHAAAAFGAGVLASVAASLAVLPGGVTVLESFAVVGATQTLVTIAVVARLAKARRTEPLGMRPAVSDLPYFFLGGALAVGVSWATYVVVQALFGGKAPVQSVVVVAGDAGGWAARAAVLAVAVVLAPVAEEMVFRGVLLRALEHRLGRQAGRYGSALCFALVHLALDFDAAPAVPALFVMGLVLAVVVQRRGRLAPAVVAHMGFNLMGVLALMFL